MPFKTIYWFEDTSDPATCVGNVCQTMEGWYDDYPARPHGGLCDCPIQMYVGYATYVYKAYKQVGGGELTRESEETTTYPNPHPTEEITASVEVTFTKKRVVKVEVQEIMQYFGFSASEEVTRTITRTLPIKIPPQHEARVTAIISGTITRFTAEKWATFTNYHDAIGGPDAPEQGEVYVGTEEGGMLYDESSDVHFDVDLTPL